MTLVHPELTHQEHWSDFFRNFTSDAAYQAALATPFLPGSYSYHWHNRCGPNTHSEFTRAICCYIGLWH